MKIIRIFFMALGAIWAIGVIAIGLGGTYLTHNPDEAAAYAVATMDVDHDTGLIDQAGQMADNYSDARAMMQEARSAENDYRARQQREAAAAQGWGGDSVDSGGWAADSASGFAE